MLASWLAAPALAAPVAQGRLGVLLTTKDGGQVFGFDINQHGDDGVLASAQTLSADGTMLVSVETFDQNTGAITGSFAQYMDKQNSFSIDGIFAGDVALVTHYFIPKGTIFAKRYFQKIDPVTANGFTGFWSPPLQDIDIQAVGTNQTTHQVALFVIQLDDADNPTILVSDIAANKFAPVIQLDPNKFAGYTSLKFAQFTAGNQAVFALSPDGGRVRGAAPLNILVDLGTGEETQFKGYNNGPYHAGYVDGLGVDPFTGVAATVTELNAQVEFYDLNSMTGITAVQLPCTGDADQLSAGSGIASDPVHKVFLVTEKYYCGTQNGAVLVYNESGTLLETITGFHFAVGEPAPVLNPSKRMGWAFGGPAGFSQLQQFFY